ncbi:MAG: hypothetical protein NVSMB29_04270 [Candidatus Dormibacteria bacterium]
MIGLWQQMRDYGAHHGVDPLVFAALYVARLPLLLTSLAVLTQRARRRQSVLPAGLLFMGLGVFPYTYILAFGRGLPVWLEVAAAALTLLAVAQSARTLRRVLRSTGRMRAEAGNGEVPCSGR